MSDFVEYRRPTEHGTGIECVSSRRWNVHARARCLADVLPVVRLQSSPRNHGVQHSGGAKMAQAQGQRGVISGQAAEALKLTGPQSRQHEVVDEDDCCSHRLSDGLSTVERVTTALTRGAGGAQAGQGLGRKRKNTAHTGGKRSPSSFQAKEVWVADHLTGGEM